MSRGELGFMNRKQVNTALKERIIKPPLIASFNRRR